MVVGGYPPSRHFLTDLGMEAEVTSESSAKVRIPVTPYVTGPDGGVRAGVLATLVDVVGGAAALRSLHPDWMATADLALQVVRPAVGPYVEARATVLRRGRTTLVVEALVFDVEHDGADAAGDGSEGAGSPLAWASMTFAVLPGRDTNPMQDASSDLPVRWALTGSGLEGPVDDVLSISVDDAASGLVSLPIRPYLRNSFGAVQGGVMATLGEVACVEMLGADVGFEGVPVVTDLQVAYLSLGRVGPIVSRSKRLDGGAGRSTGSAVVELLDRGADDRLTTVINVRAASVPTTPPGGDHE
ncbi:MAG: PaaI family thioesterase [Acidimicrobiales bacterium]